jgi:uncharacterized protein (TIGR02099 family)
MPRICLRLLAGAAAFFLILFTAGVFWLRYIALPDVDRYRPELIASIEKATGMVVGIEGVRGGWGGLRPVLSLEGVSVDDRAGRAAFRLERAEATLSWWSLFQGELRFHDLDFYRPDLVLRRGADGLIYLADKPINAAGPGGDGAFTEWLLAQRRLGIHDATLTWRDDFAGAPEVRLSGVEIAIAKRRGRHRAALTAAPPRDLATRIELRTDVALERQGERWRARGEAYGEAVNADLARLRNHLPVPETLRTGVGSARLWLAFTPEGVNEVTADVNMRDARVQLAADALPLQLATLSGRAIYASGPTGFSLATEQLRFRLASGAEASPGRFAVVRTVSPNAPARVEFSADNIDLKIAATLVDYFPVPRDIKDQVLRFAPRGRIADARISWHENARSYSVKGRFEGLAVNAGEAYPGASGLTGTIEGTEAGGLLRLESRGATFEAARIFAAPLAFDAVDATARWKHVDGKVEVEVEKARLANPDGVLEFTGTWRTGPAHPDRHSPGIVDFKGTLQRVAVPRLPAYLPNVISGTREYLAKALSAGELKSARFELRGDVWEFPFGKGRDGRFLVDAQVRNARLVYHPDWPSVDAIEGTVKFENDSMEIRAERGLIFTSRVRRASAIIPELGARPAVLAIDGDIDTTGADSMRFLRESPLVKGPGAFTRAVSVEGPARLKLHLGIPLSGTEPIKVVGEYQFDGATASVARSLALREVRGRLAFTERGVSAPDIAGTLFGKAAALALSTEADGRVLTTVSGLVDAATLAEFAPGAFAQRLSGTSEWSARVLSGEQGTEVTVASDLKGLASGLPAPLDKPAEAARPLVVRVSHAGSESELVEASLGSDVHWRSTRRGPSEAQAWSVALKLGAAPGNEALREGIWLYGNIDSIDADAWTGVFDTPATATATPATGTRFGLRGIDMRFGRVRFKGREFVRTGARIEQSGSAWRGTLDGPMVAGTIAWDPAGRGRVDARLAHLALPEASPAQTPGGASRESQDPPAVSLVADRFEFRGRELGKLEFKADYAGDEWRIEKLDITNAHAQYRSSGSWRRTGSGGLTTMNLKLETTSLDLLLGQFGYADYIRRGTGTLEGTLAWPGYPNDFNTSILSGSFKVHANRGQFAKLEPGAGKLLGLLSLQSLPRRVTLDFSDLFSEGFAFETIEGDVKLARGLMLTDAFTISGPSALVSISGEASLPQETQTITLRVVPEMGESAAVAATVLGTPVLGLSTLLISKLLSNPLGKVVAYEYLVTGSWDNPVVTKISAPPPRPAKAASTADAKK